jgi:hypothetical protein
MNASDTQHKTSYPAQPGFGFDDAGELVPVVPDSSTNELACSDGDEARIRQETILRVFTMLLEGDGNAEVIGRRVLWIGRGLKCHGAPRTDTDLAKRLRLTKGRVSQLRALERAGKLNLTCPL